MDRERQTQGIPEALAARLTTGQSGRCFRRRAVIMKIEGRLELLCCTVERLARCSNEQAVPSRRYSNALLYEDLLTEAQCLQFANELHTGQGCIGECELETHAVPNWQPRRVSTSDGYMQSAGLVFSVSAGNHTARPPIAPLLEPDQPYYPDLYEAARDWLPFTTYHGQHDGRNNQITFLLSEDRAFIKEVAFLEPGRLTIEIAGTEVHALELLVKGAYWTQGAIAHFEHRVTCPKVVAAASEDADRLEFYLLDLAGNTFDFFSEDRNSRLHADNRVLRASARTQEARIYAAAASGEGQKVEFKPFVDPNEKMKNGVGEKSKDRKSTRLNSSH